MVSSLFIRLDPRPKYIVPSTDRSQSESYSARGSRARMSSCEAKRETTLPYIAKPGKLCTCIKNLYLEIWWGGGGFSTPKHPVVYGLVQQVHSAPIPWVTDLQNLWSRTNTSRSRDFGLWRISPQHRCQPSLFWRDSPAFSVSVQCCPRLLEYPLSTVLPLYLQVNWSLNTV